MILEILKSILGLGARPNAKRQPTKEELMHQFLAESVSRSPYIKEECRDAVTAGFLRSGNEPYRINEADLTAEGLRRGVKNSTTAVYMQARHRIGRLETIDQIRDAGYKLFSLQDSNDERDCPWCKANSGKKFPIGTDIDGLIEDNCTCEYCRCWIRSRRN